MAHRSEAVSVALILLPNIFIVSFRIFSPELNDALSNDNFSEIAIHSVATVSYTHLTLPTILLV